MNLKTIRPLLLIITASISLAISGCVAPPTQQELATIDYGPAPTNYEALIKARFEESLFDPYSAQYVFSPPEQFWFKEAPMMGGRLYSGWMVKTGINAKNRMGGYTGRKYYGVIIKNGQVIRILEDFELQNMRRM